jgi:Polysaccharide lyase family 8, super-sandwich domain/Polysaccharide lyase family 8, N terminal alpha-helical domain/Polysaccharide lyase family 8, C-terminal beta-sandwich domain
MKKLLLPLVLFVATAATAADIDRVRAQFLAYHTAGGADRSSTRMREALADLEASAQHVTAPGFLLSDGTWSDIDYADSPEGDWSPWAHTQRLRVMARAYQTPGQAFYKSATLLGQIDAALAQTKRFYGATIIPSGNWWFWTMGIPLDLGPTLVLMRDEINQNTYNDLVTAIHVRIFNSPASKGLVGPTPTGQNLVWSCFTHLSLALLKDDAAMLAAVGNAMSSVTLPANGDGIKRDRSFHQHGPQLYTGGYGGAFANDVAKYALITRGTSIGLNSAALASFNDYIADGVAWSLHGDYFDVSVVGREVARPTTSGFNGLAAMLQASEIDSPRAAEIRSAAAKMLQSWRGTMSTELAGLAAKIESARVAPVWPSGHRHFFASDYTVHRRDGWLASIKMFSTRTKSGERTNGENLLGARQSDGRFNLVLKGNEYFGRDIFPSLDWTRLPGITVEQKADTANDTYGFGRNLIAGGTSDSRNGVTAMELAPLNSSLTAKKAWFFFDDAIVFLTNSITSPGTNRVETIVNQWPLMNPASQLARGTDWAALEGVGYWFPTNTDVRTARETRTGTWASLGASTDATPHTHPYVTLYFDHGTAPVNATAEYVIVPNMTAEKMRQWTATRPIAILANNDRVSAARDLRTGNLGITFWLAGASFEGFQTSAPAVVYITEPATRTMKLSIADPTGAPTGSFQFTVPGSWDLAPGTPASGATLLSRTASATTLSIARRAGETAEVVLVRGGGRRRAVGR